MATSKLHEILAVDGQLKNQADATRKELTGTFDKRRHHFVKKLVTFIPNTENAQPVTEEQLDLQTTIPKELKWIGEKIAAAVDVAYQVEIGNTLAKADVVFPDGSTFLKDMPATALLNLEKRLSEIETIVKAIPTLDPVKGFEPDPDSGAGVFRARDINVVRTRKTLQPLVLYAATKEHPAQVKEISVDVPIGTLRTQEWSSLITVADKGDMLDRLEMLSRAVKQARTRANELSLDPATLKIGARVFDYIVGVKNAAEAKLAKGDTTK